MYGASAGMQPKYIKDKKIATNNQKVIFDGKENGNNVILKPRTTKIRYKGNKNNIKIASSMLIAPPTLSGHARKIA